MKKFVLVLLGMFLFSVVESADATMYECYYKNKRETFVTSSFNSLNKKNENYQKLYSLYKNGACKELIVKRYVIDGTMCNIQFYRYNNRISHLSCPAHRQDALVKLREIAKKEYGYY